MLKLVAIKAGAPRGALITSKDVEGKVKVELIWDNATSPTLEL